MQSNKSEALLFSVISDAYKALLLYGLVTHVDLLLKTQENKNPAFHKGHHGEQGGLTSKVRRISVSHKSW